jgi:hypothetical protein
MGDPGLTATTAQSRRGCELSAGWQRSSGQYLCIDTTSVAPMAESTVNHIVVCRMIERPQ